MSLISIRPKIFLKKYGMKLNPKKCVFNVGFEKFLRFMFNQRGIEANPKKIKTLINMHPFRIIKEVKRSL